MACEAMRKTLNSVAMDGKIIVGEGEQGTTDLLYRGVLFLERLTFRWADVVIATNESYRAVALSRGGKQADDVVVVRSGPDLTRFPRPDLTAERTAGRLRIAYLGVMGPQDGIDHALRALAVLAEQRADWRATFGGAGDVRGAMRGLAGDGRRHVTVTSAERIPKDAARRACLRAVVEEKTGAGGFNARAAGGQQSSQLRPLAEANALLVVPEGEAAALPGTEYEAILLAEPR